MSILSRFPFLEGLIEPSTLDRLDQRFSEKCASVGIELNTPEAEEIGINLIADHASGWPSSKPSSCNLELGSFDRRCNRPLRQGKRVVAERN